MIKKSLITIFAMYVCLFSTNVYAFFPELNLLKPTLHGERNAIPVLGSTVIIKGLTDQVNQVFVNGGEIAVQKDGSFLEETIIPIGTTTIEVKAVEANGASNVYSKDITATEDHFFFVGIADGTINFVDASENFNLRRDNTSFDDGTHSNGKISYYLAGKLKGKYLIKSSLDTDKATQEKLFTNIDPDKYYPIYGDNSTVVYDSNSQGKLYIQVDWDESGIVLGNYQTQIGSDESLAKYDRTLYGVKLHVETQEKTVYGDVVTQGKVFVAEANQLSGHSELLGTGGSLYYLRHRNIVEGSERVRIDIRDKYSKTTIASIPQAQNVDYEIKYDEGRILFRKPVTSLITAGSVITESIQEGHEVFVITDYEYKDQDAFPIDLGDIDKQSAGFRVQHGIGDHIQIGGTYVQEERDIKHHSMYAVDTLIQVGNFSKVYVEYAETLDESSSSYISYNGGYDYTESDVDALVNGKALKVKVDTSLGELLGKDKEYVNISGFYQSIDKGFSPAASLFEAGTKKHGVKVSHRFTENDTAYVMYEDNYLDEGADNQAALNDLAAERTTNISAQWQHDQGKWRFTSEFLNQQKNNSLSTVFDKNAKTSSDYIIAERVRYDWSDKTQLYVGQQIGLSDTTDNYTSAGIKHWLNDDIALNLRGGFGQDRNSILTGLERRVDPYTTTYLNYALSEDLLDGNQSTLTSGSQTQLSNTASLHAERQYVTSDTRGVYSSELLGYTFEIKPGWDIDASYERREESSTGTLRGSVPREAVSVSTSYVKPDKYKWYSKFEYRVDTGDEWQVLSDNQGELKLTDDLFLYGEYEYSQGKDVTADTANSRIDKKQIAIAFRPVDYDWLNGLFKYIRLRDDRPRDLTSADGGFLTIESTYDEFAAEYAVDLPWNLQFVQKGVYREGEILAVNTTNTISTPEDQRAYLSIFRMNYHLTGKIDLAGEYRTLRQEGSDISKTEGGFLAEFTYKVMDHLAIGVGYNSTSFKDNFRSLIKQKAEGAFVRIQATY